MKKDKYVGICKVGDKGQIVITVEARSMFDIKPGDSIIFYVIKKGDSSCRIGCNRRFSK